MNAVATAENRPAYHSDEHTFKNAFRGAHEDQECVQVLFTVLEGCLVVVFGYPVVALVEFGSVFLLIGRGLFVLLQTVRWYQQHIDYVGKRFTSPPVVEIAVVLQELVWE